MSGGGGGGGSNDDWRRAGGGGGAGSGGPDKCAFTERTILNSPNSAVVSTLNGGEVLLVELESQPRKRVIVKTAAGVLAGAITSARLVDIIECLELGVAYEAEVLSISGGRIEIEVRPA